MVLLHTSFASGNQFTAGSNYGDVGASGINDVCNRVNLIVESPVGTVNSWLKDFTNTPALPPAWLECNGQTVSDADSVYNGQAIPNLNGSGTGAQRFLRGAETTGGSGGNIITGGVTGAPETGATGAGNPSAPKTHTHDGNEPPFYDVVWIMRIK